MADNRQRTILTRPTATRRGLLTAGAVAPVLVGAATPDARALPRERPRALIKPTMTVLADWAEVTKALGRPGEMKRYMYHTGLPRRDLDVVSRGVRIETALALGTHVSFVRYEDGAHLLMGDAVVTEQELQGFSDTLLEHGIGITAVHKHLLAHKPAVWWLHLHAHAHDPVPVAKGLRAAFGRTGTPPYRPPTAPPPLALDTKGIDGVFGVAGFQDEGIYKSTWVRTERILDGDMILPPGLGATTTVNFQPVGGGRAVTNGDFVMTASEVQPVLRILRKGGVELVELHHHNLTDEPRLFFVHYWGTGDAVRLAKVLREAVHATAVVPMAGVTG
ncbi:DUF1259 domain-containing protein [Streptomyces sp. GbtcB6]|uniref:DUF1259 domain-containing protein n=1 Tax=Streptomyces sp. GbtcB6 TaxID=2824751 RepID=UPI001C30918C|nr:DUF1259 domain-containing protein [Streptomyces sp. GbtcB6]